MNKLKLILGILLITVMILIVAISINKVKSGDIIENGDKSVTNIAKYQADFIKNVKRIYSPESEEQFKESRIKLLEYMEYETMENFTGKYSQYSGLVKFEIIELLYGYKENQDDEKPKMYMHAKSTVYGEEHYMHFIFLYNDKNKIYDYILY